MVFIAPFNPYPLDTNSIYIHWLDTNAHLHYWYSPFTRVWILIGRGCFNLTKDRYGRIIKIMES